MATYALPGVKPNVRQCANDLGPRFGITTIYGVGARANASDHPKGLALDFMCSVAVGRQLVAALIANWDRYGLTYIIHEQKILTSPNGQWERMADRGSVTANHFDHVHVSFKNTAVTGTLNISGDPNAPWNSDPGSLGPANGVDAAVNGAGEFLAFVTNSDNWKRVALFIAGVAALLIALFPLLKGVTNGR